MIAWLCKWIHRLTRRRLPLDDHRVVQALIDQQ